VRGRDRMLVAPRRGQPDVVPVWELIINEPVIRAICGDCSYADLIEMLDMDGCTAGEDVRFEELGEERTGAGRARASVGSSTRSGAP